MSNITAVVLAAGMGTRMKSSTPKVLHKICGYELVNYVLDAAKNAGVNQIISVIGNGAEMVRDVLGDKSEYALQEERLGTGHACMQAIPKITGEHTIVLCGDAPLITSETLNALIDEHIKNGNSATVISAKLDNPFGYGRIVKNADGTLKKIVEQKDADEATRKINEINSGIYIFKTEELISALGKISNNNAQGEYYLTDTVEIISLENKKVGVFTISDSNEILGINDRLQLSNAEKLMQKRIVEKHMLGGVTIHSPETVIISPNCEIGEDTEIYANVTIRGNSKIGSGVIITSATEIVDSEIADKVNIKSSVILESKVGENTTVGPFAYIRPNCVVGKDVRVGDFVELKNANIGNGTKVSHLTYVGDSDVGEGCNFGCGTVTVNYDGKKKYRTVIGNNVFIGCNSNLVAPVTLKDGAYTAAGSTITMEVPENNLAIARARQVNKEIWNDKRK